MAKNTIELKEIQAIFGIRLKSCLESRKISQSKFADMINSNRSTLSRYCSGQHLPEIEDLCRIAQALNVSTDYLLGRTDTESTKIEVRAISELIGIPENCISAFAELKEEINGFSHEIDINSFYSSVFDKSFFDLLELCILTRLDINLLSEAISEFPLSEDVIKRIYEIGYCMMDYESYCAAREKKPINQKQELFELDTWKRLTEFMIEKAELDEHKASKQCLKWLDDVTDSDHLEDLVLLRKLGYTSLAKQHYDIKQKEKE